MRLFDWDETPDLNITPFVDVMLVLMAILMVTAPTITFQEKITLPQGTRTHKVKKLTPLTIRMDKTGRIYLGKETFTRRDFADNFVLKARTIDKATPIFIRADERLRYADVMYLLRTVKAAGFVQVSLLTQ
ncbi:biopolymer transporter ExbD [Nitratifractor sp.]